MYVKLNFVMVCDKSDTCFNLKKKNYFSLLFGFILSSWAYRFSKYLKIFIIFSVWDAIQMLLSLDS